MSVMFGGGATESYVKGYNKDSSVRVLFCTDSVFPLCGLLTRDGILGQDGTLLTLLHSFPVSSVPSDHCQISNFSNNDRGNHT